MPPFLPSVRSILPPAGSGQEAKTFPFRGRVASGRGDRPVARTNGEWRMVQNPLFAIPYSLFPIRYSLLTTRYILNEGRCPTPVHPGPPPRWPRFCFLLSRKKSRDGTRITLTGATRKERCPVVVSVAHPVHSGHGFFPFPPERQPLPPHAVRPHPGERGN
jgi:hypothetical protein